MSTSSPGGAERDGSSRLPRWLGSRRRRIAACGAVLLVAAGAVIGATDPFAGSVGSSAGVTDNTYPTSTATVDERSLSSQTQVSATLGYAGTYDVTIPTGTAAATVAQDRKSVLSDEEKVATDELTLSNAEAVAKPDGASTLLTAEATVTTDETSLAQAKTQLAADHRLSCPASSSATVTAAGSASPSSTGSSTGSGNGSSTGSGMGAVAGNTGTKSSGSGTTSTSSPSTPAGTSGASFRARDALVGTGNTGNTGVGNTGSGPSAPTTTQPASAPVAATGTVDGTSSTATTLMGSVDPDGADTTYYFEYGTSADYGETTPSTGAGAGTSQSAVNVGLSGLLPGETYHYRLVAKNSVGTSYGQDATFTTTAVPTAVTGSGTMTTPSSESLAGTVDSGGLDTTYYFEWGPSAALGRRTPVEDAGAGTSAASVAVTVSSLKADATYDFRLVATNALGTSVGSTQTFLSAASSCIAQAAVVRADTEALRTAKDSLSADHLDGGSSVTSDEQSVTSDEQNLQAAQQALSTDETNATNPGATFTALPAAGTVVRRGERVYALDGRLVPLFYGTVTLYRDLYLGVANGPDVTELQENLIALGFGNGLSATAHFSAATELAVKAWQGSLGVAQTGVVSLGDVVIAPSSIEVDTVSASDGASASAGLAVLSATSTTPEVSIALDASQQSEVKVGDPVTITLPDDATTPGVVSSIGKIATSSSSSSSNTGSGSSATINVEVTPTDPKATGGLDQAPVEVSITTASVASALVVPVDALLALSGGGYALEEIDPAGVHHLLAVTLGLFDDAAGLVQVSGSGVAAGQRVVVPGV